MHRKSYVLINICVCVEKALVMHQQVVYESDCLYLIHDIHFAMKVFGNSFPYPYFLSLNKKTDLSARN